MLLQQLKSLDSAGPCCTVCVGCLTTQSTYGNGQLRPPFWLILHFIFLTHVCSMWLPHDAVLIRHVHVFCIIPLLWMHRFCSKILASVNGQSYKTAKPQLLRLIFVNICLASAELLTASQFARWQLHCTQSNDRQLMQPQTRSISLT